MGHLPRLLRAAHPHHVLICQPRYSFGDVEDFAQGPGGLGTFGVVPVLPQFADRPARDVAKSGAGHRQQRIGPGDALRGAVGQGIAQFFDRIQQVTAQIIPQPGQATSHHPFRSSRSQIPGSGRGEAARQFVGLVDDQRIVLWKRRAAVHGVDRHQGMVGDDQVRFASRLP